ncbi:type II secretion system secretin GspD [Ideonella sp. A 288]|uniref:type II secretion system secretin GspD n=1 Tax=Ideonella sp. A 288 TaxID=1962181 RepID=UPI000B4ABA74|nr:type II secretion system secretin GspD [Ideonella sp. A 288]
MATGSVLPSTAQVAADKPAARTSTPSMSSAPVTLNFVNADIEAVTRAISAMINRQIMVDPRVKGSMTVYSERAMPPREAYQNYLSALRGMGFSVVDSAGLLKVVPEADAKLQTGVVSVGPVDQRADLVITQIFRLSHENPNNLVAVLRPLISPNNTINANPGNGSLVITDYADNLARIAKIIAALDQPASTDIEVIPLKHAVAADLATLVQRLGEGGAGGVAALVPGGGAGSATVMVDTRSNALIIRAQNPARLAAMRALIQRLDQPGAAGPAGSIHVVALKNADAARLATVLRAAFAAGSSGGGSGLSGSTATGGGSLGGSPAAPTSQSSPSNTGAGSSAATTPVAASAQPSTGGFIQADAATNSLIISAPEPLYLQIRAVIDRLDERRAQVYIESMIVEVSGDDTAELGFQWLGALGSEGRAVQNLPSTKSPGIISINSGLASNNLTLGEGLNLGLLRTVNGVASLSAILRMLQTKGNTNVVSTPNMITLDNEEAKIVVGENVPFITGQFTSTGTSTNNPFQTIERKDVGITLRIRPQIGEGGAIRMQIYQEQSSVKDTTAAGTSNAGPSTTKRSIEGTVTVDDGQVLALGGLIEDNYSTTTSKVPLLGDLPWVGALFRNESRTRKRTNLMVFLRPVVLRDTASTQKLSLDRYDLMRGQQKDAQPNTSVLLPINEAPVLPPMREPAAPSSPPPLSPAPPPTPSPGN